MHLFIVSCQHKVSRNPTKLVLRITYLEIADNFRRLDCRSYNDCMRYAAKQKWNGFSCNECSEHDPMSPKERQLDNQLILEKLLPAAADELKKNPFTVHELLFGIH